jgi:hypothetical protein
MAAVVAILPNIPNVPILAVWLGIGVNNTSISLTSAATRFGAWTVPNGFSSSYR